jgi:RNAse (barnase) inhibitor barstar
MEKPSRTIDGTHFDTLEGFFLAFQDSVLDGAQWGSNLDAFNDVLRGGFGSPDGGFILIWKNHATSQERLGFKETVRQLERRLTGCHPANTQRVLSDLENAKSGVGTTVYDWLLEILRCHGPGGDEEEDGIDLVLA